MRRKSLPLWKTGAGFLAGLAGAWWWPATDAGRKPSSRQAASSASFAVQSNVALPPGGLARQLSAHRKAEELTATQAKDLMMQLNPPVPEKELPWWEEVLKRWAEEEPEETASWIQAYAHTGETVPDVLLYAALKPLARKNLRSALTVARRSARAMYGARSELPAAAAERDPRGTMDFLEKEPRFLTQFGAKAMGVWLRNDPAAACAWLSASPARANLMAAVMPDLVEAAPDRIQELMAALPEDSPARKAMQAGAAWAGVSSDFPGTLEKFKISSPVERESMREAVSAHAALYGTPEEIDGLLASLNKDERYSMLFMMSGIVSGTDENRILEVLRKTSLTGPERDRLLAQCSTLGPQYAGLFMEAAKSSVDFNAMNGAANFWRFNLTEHTAETLPVFQKMVESGQVDSSVLLAMIPYTGTRENERWIAVLPEEKQALPRAWSALSRALADSTADLNSVIELQDPKTATAAIAGFFNGAGGTHEQVRDLISRLPDSMQAEAINAFPFFEKDGTMLAPLVEKILASGTSNEEVMTPVVQKVASSLPASEDKAMQWLDSLPPGPCVAAARTGAFDSWVSDNEVAAAAWLGSQPSDLPHRDQMIRGLVYTLASHDPESAWQWASTVPDSDNRASLFETVLSKWRVVDPAAAAAAASREP